MKVPECKCELAKTIPEGPQGRRGRFAWCPHVKTYLTQTWCNLCRTDATYREALEGGHGTGQSGKTPDSPPSTRSPNPAKKAWNYGKAIAKWIAAGRPVRSEAEIQRIFTDICQPCRSFDRKNKGCRVCGCGEELPAIVRVVAAALEASMGRVNRLPLRLLRKIAMATESCPKAKWSGYRRASPHV